jgi:hypothetical protein
VLISNTDICQVEWAYLALERVSAN